MLPTVCLSSSLVNSAALPPSSSGNRFHIVLWALSIDCLLVSISQGIDSLLGLGKRTECKVWTSNGRDCPDMTASVGHSLWLMQACKAKLLLWGRVPHWKCDGPGVSTQSSNVLGEQSLQSFCSEDAPIPGQPISSHLTSIFRDQQVACIFSLWKISTLFKDF